MLWVRLTPDCDNYLSTALQPVFLDFKDFFYVFPPNEDGIVKLSKHARGYLNKQVSLADPEAFVSMPRTALFAGNSGEHIPKPALDELRTHLSKIWPRLAEKPFASTRMCWWARSAFIHQDQLKLHQVLRY